MANPTPAGAVKPRFTDLTVRREVLEKVGTVQADNLVWVCVHGCVSLALRHPAYTGPSRGLAKSFRDALGKKLVEDGVLTPAELAYAERVEREESPHGE